MDQPLFAIAKHIQWEKADFYGEEEYVVMMGGLHVELNHFVENDWPLDGQKRVGQCIRTS